MRRLRVAKGLQDGIVKKARWRGMDGDGGKDLFSAATRRHGEYENEDKEGNKLDAKVLDR